jgi:hypothetical protein
MLKLFRSSLEASGTRNISPDGLSPNEADARTVHVPPEAQGNPREGTEAQIEATGWARGRGAHIKRD